MDGTTPLPEEKPKTDRQIWMSILSRANANDLENAWRELADKPDYDFLRKPETGMIMVRGRAGGTGNQFNLGEMTITRCVVRLEDSINGYGYVAGRNARHAELMALFDGLMQRPERRQEIDEVVIEPISRLYEQKKQKAQAKTAATKVDFFTMVRGDD